MNMHGLPTGARTSRYDGFNLDAYAAELLASYTRLPIAEIVERNLSDALSRPGAAEAAMTYALTNALSRIERNPAPKISVAARQEKIATGRLLRESFKEEITRQMSLLGMIAPNGKILAQCTLRDCRNFGSWYAALAADKPLGDLVMKHYSDDALRAAKTWS